MTRTYYCEYCDVSFKDVLAVRKAHLTGAQHKEMKKRHFDRFQDVPAFLKTERAKGVCSRIVNNMECTFGVRCRYSHYFPEQLDEIEKKHQREADELRIKQQIEAFKENPSSSWVYNHIQRIRNLELTPSLQQWTKSSAAADLKEWGK